MFDVCIMDPGSGLRVQSLWFWKEGLGFLAEAAEGPLIGCCYLQYMNGFCLRILCCTMLYTICHR